MKVYNLKVVIEPSEDGGFIVECPELQGCYTSGETFEETVRNIKEAIRAHIEDRIADDESIPEEMDFTASIETTVSVTI